MMKMERLSMLHPSADALLAVLRPWLDDAVLRKIAEADYGTDVEAHLRALRRIRDQGKVSSPLRWEPREVLALTRWSHPAGAADSTSVASPGAFWSAGRDFHVARAFSCAVLLIAGANPANSGYAELTVEEQTAAPLIASALALGPEVGEAASSLLAWRIAPGSPLGPMDRPFFAFGILVLATALRLPHWSEEDIGELAEWVLSEEQAARAHLGARRTRGRGKRWLLDLSQGQSHRIWRELGKHLAEDAAQMSSAEARARVSDVYTRLREAV